MELLTLVNDFAVRNNCIAGICTGEPLADAQARMENRFTPFVSLDLNRRTDPARILPGVKSIIVLGIGHAAAVGWLSSLGVNEDYHGTLKQLLRDLAGLIQTHTPCNYKILIDSGTLDERALAVRAGLGFFTRNGMVTSPVLGSFFHIGVLLTDLEALKTEPYAGVCPENCRLCADGCPGGAIPSEGYAIDVSRCVSYLTQKPGPLTPDEMTRIGCHLYGCDVCRLVCSFNQNGKRMEQTVSPEAWLTMDETGFTATYGHTAILWHGTDLLRRNALIVLGNRVCDRETAAKWLSLVRTFTESTDAGIASAARYAYEKLTSRTGACL